MSILIGKFEDEIRQLVAQYKGPWIGANGAVSIKSGGMTFASERSISANTVEIEVGLDVTDTTQCEENSSLEMPHRAKVVVQVTFTDCDGGFNCRMEIIGASIVY